MSSATAASASSAITLKTVFNGESRRFVLNKPSFPDLIHQLSVYYPQLSGADVVLKYEDDENELITISTDNELLEAFHVANNGNKTLKLTVSSSNTNTASSSPATAAAAAAIATGASSDSSAAVKAVVSGSTLPHSPVVHTTTPHESPVQVESKDPPVSATTSASASIPVPPPASNTPAAAAPAAPAAAAAAAAARTLPSTVKVTEVNEKEDGEEDDSSSDEDEEDNNEKDVSDVLGALLGLGTELSDLLSSSEEPASSSSSSSRCANGGASACASACSRSAAATAAAAAAAETKSEEHVWGNIECDGCGVFPLRGVRFTCTVCKDFDLCASCESRGVHPRHHPLIKAQLPPSAAKDEKAIHTHITCDGCGTKPIQGLRFKCTVCPDFDLCERCEARRLHPADHPLLKLRMERRLPAVLPPFFRGSAAVNEEEVDQQSQQPHPFHAFQRFNPFRFFTRPRPHPQPRPHCHPHFQRFQRFQHPCQPSSSFSSSASPSFSRCGRVPGRCGIFVARPVFPESASATAAAAAAHQADSKADSKPVDKTVPAIAVKFVRDVTLSDGSSVVQGSKPVKTWQLQNTGSASWPAGTKLIFVRGDRDLIGEVEEFPLESVVIPGAVVDVSVPLAVPVLSSSSSLNPAPRRYAAYFQLADADRRVFGPRIWVDVKVVAREDEEKKTPAAADAAPAVTAAAIAEPNPAATAPSTASVPAAAAAVVDNSALTAAPTTSAPAAPAPSVAAAAAAESVRPPSPHDWVDVKAETAVPASAPASSGPAAVSTAASTPAPAPAAAAAASTNNSKYAKQLSALQQMGFDNVSVNSFLLEKNHGDLVATANWLIEHTK